MCINDCQRISISYLPACAQSAGRMENVVGWYHSHPGYGCWLSGIDCSTQVRARRSHHGIMQLSGSV